MTISSFVRSSYGENPYLMRKKKVRRAVGEDSTSEEKHGRQKGATTSGGGVREGMGRSIKGGEAGVSERGRGNNERGASRMSL